MNELVINGISDIKEMATIMSKSGLFGKNPEQMFALMLIAQAEGIHPAIAAQEYDVIQGRPALKSQSALARFQQAGGTIQWKTKNEAEATAIFSHPQGGSLPVTWTMERAKKMGLDQKDNWKKQPGIMLSWRTVAEGIRAVFPACLNRMYLAEEVVDFEAPRTERNVTPEAEKPLEVTAEPKPESDPWLAERQTRMDALTPIVLKFTKEAREKLELKSLLTRAVKEPVCMDIAEIRARIYGKYKNSEFIANIYDTILALGIDKEKLLGYESGMTVPVEAQEEKKGEAEDGPADDGQMF